MLVLVDRSAKLSGVLLGLIIIISIIKLCNNDSFGYEGNL